MIDALKKSDFFVGLDEQALTAIAGFAQTMTFEPNATVFDRDDEARYAYLVLKGRVRQGFEVMPGSMVWFQSCEPGDLVGFAALISPHIYNMKAVASERTEVLAFDSNSLLGYLEANPGFGFMFMERLAQTLRQRLNNTRLQVIHLMPPKEGEGPTLEKR
jgi:CRP/FNR family cyclic AMP-dependent transcriptional regulator